MKEIMKNENLMMRYVVSLENIPLD